MSAKRMLVSQSQDSRIYRSSAPGSLEFTDIRSIMS